MKTILFVLGNPGSGKSTLCRNLSKSQQFEHLSLGDLLRNDQEQREVIQDHIRVGKLIPSAITIKVLKQALDGHDDGNCILIEWISEEYGKLTILEYS